MVQLYDKKADQYASDSERIRYGLPSLGMDFGSEHVWGYRYTVRLSIAPWNPPTTRSCGQPADDPPSR